MSAVFSLPLLQILTGTDTSLGYRPRHFAPVSATVMSAATHPPIDPSAQCDILRRSIRAMRYPPNDPSAQCEIRPSIHPRNATPAHRTRITLSLRPSRRLCVSRRLFCRPSSRATCGPSCRRCCRVSCLFVASRRRSCRASCSEVVLHLAPHATENIFCDALSEITLPRRPPCCVDRLVGSVPLTSHVLSGLVSFCRLRSAILSGVTFGRCLASRMLRTTSLAMR